MTEQAPEPSRFDCEALQRQISFGSVILADGMRCELRYVIVGMKASHLDAAHILDDAKAKLGGIGTMRYVDVTGVTDEVWPVEQIIAGISSFYPKTDEMKTIIETEMYKAAARAVAFKATLK